ncbi:MAG: GTPase Era [Bdellovibrionaceae bacterium]|nr:GTPase Era [Pseudobdellovibrionaceae bacterium]
MKNGYKAGFVGLIGEPNAGKSTLMNYLIDEKVSIVSPKPQTTRRRVHGIHSHEEGQIVFVDSPGLVHAKEGLNAFLEKEAAEVVKESDALIAVLSVDSEKKENIEDVIALVVKSGKPWMAVITKTDLAAKAHRVVTIRKLLEGYNVPIVAVSLCQDEYEQEKPMLLEQIRSLLPVSEKAMYDEDIYTQESVRDLVCEIVREKCFEFCHQEIPYNLAVRTIKFDEESKKVPHLSLEIIVAKENHKGIVIGKAAENLKKIGSEARKDIEKLMGEKIFLDLKVSCREDWFKNDRIMKELGYFHEKNRTKN